MKVFKRRELTARQRWMRCAMQVCLYVGIMAFSVGMPAGTKAVMNYGHTLPPGQIYTVQPLGLTGSAAYILGSLVLLILAAFIADKLKEKA